jgi:hypothetical protein
MLLLTKHEQLHIRERVYTPVLGRAALVASCLRGTLPPVALRAVCLVRAIYEGRETRLSRESSKSSWDEV